VKTPSSTPTLRRLKPSVRAINWPLPRSNCSLRAPSCPRQFSCPRAIWPRSSVNWRWRHGASRWPNCSRRRTRSRGCAPWWSARTARLPSSS